MSQRKKCKMVIELHYNLVLYLLYKVQASMVRWFFFFPCSEGWEKLICCAKLVLKVVRGLYTRSYSIMPKCSKIFQPQVQPF